MADAGGVKSLHERAIADTNGRVEVRSFDQPGNLRLVEHVRQWLLFAREGQTLSRAVQQVATTIEPDEEGPDDREPLAQRGRGDLSAFRRLMARSGINREVAQMSFVDRAPVRDRARSP